MRGSVRWSVVLGLVAAAGLLGAVDAAVADENNATATDSAYCATHGRPFSTRCPVCVQLESAQRADVDREISDRRRLADARARYQSLLTALRDARVSLAAVQADAALPEGLAEIAGRVDRLFVQATLRKRFLNFLQGRYAAERRDLPDEIRRTEEERTRNEASASATATLLPAAQAQQATAEAAAAAEEKRSRILSKDAAATEARAAASRDRVVGLLQPLPPKAAAADLRAALGRKFRTGEFAPLRPQSEPVVASPRQAATTPQPKRPPAWWNPAPRPPAGEVEDKLHECEGLAAQLSELQPTVEAEESELSPLWTQARRVRAARDKASERLAPVVAALETATAAKDEALRRGARALGLERLFAENALKSAATSAVWDEVRERVVVPRVEAFLEANGLLHGMKAVEAVKAVAENPGVLLAAGPLKDVERLIETAKKVAAVEEGFETWATAAADALAKPGAVDRALIGGLFADVDRRGVEIMDEASRSMRGPLGKLARAFMAEAPRD